MPQSGNPSDPSLSWSVALNLALWIKIGSKLAQTLSLYVEYLDARGKQSILIDSLLHDKEEEILFSNLVKIPIKGAIKSVELKLMHQDPHIDFEINELFVRVIDAPPDPELRRKTA